MPEEDTNENAVVIPGVKVTVEVVEVDDETGETSVTRGSSYSSGDLDFADVVECFRGASIGAGYDNSTVVDYMDLGLDDEE